MTDQLHWHQNVRQWCNSNLKSLLFSPSAPFYLICLCIGLHLKNLKIELTQRFSDNLAVHGLTRPPRREKPFVLRRFFYLIHASGWITTSRPFSNKQTYQHNEDTPCASWLLGCHSSAFSPVCVRVPTGYSLRWLREYAKPHWHRWRSHGTFSW